MKVLLHAREIKEHQHTVYSKFGRRDRWHSDRQIKKVISCDLSSVEAFFDIIKFIVWAFAFTI